MPEKHKISDKLFIGKLNEMPPLNKKTLKELEKFCNRNKQAFKRSHKSFTTPKFNLRGKCPKCKSKKYFELFGGRCSKRCAKCKKAYDCVPLDEWLNK